MTRLVCVAIISTIVAIAAPPVFEVASIRQAPPLPPGRVDSRMSVDTGWLTYTGVTLQDVVRVAFGVSDLQISGPPWLNSERYDIRARIPEGARRDVPAMLETLLKERFGMQSHRADREMAVYDLVVGPKGPKMQPVEGEGSSVDSGNGHIAASKVSMAYLAEILSRTVGRPVTDRTALSGVYALKLEWNPDDLNINSVEGPSIFTAIQEQLGLRLEATKGPVSTVVIDRLEKVPTEN